MSIVIHYTHAYAFIGGLYIGKFTNLFSDVVITGLVLYIVTPEIFTEDRIAKAKNMIWNFTNRFTVDRNVKTIEQAPITVESPKLNILKIPISSPQIIT